jgi:hypothetical protein
MKRIFAAALAALASTVVFSATLAPIQLLNPTGSVSGQVITSTGASTAPVWGNVSASTLAAQAANTVLANVTASTASPTAFPMPGCSASGNALQYSTSGTGWVCATGYALTSGTLSQFASTTSAQLATLLSDETGTGAAVFATGAAINPASTGATTPGTGAFTTLAASSTVSGTGFSNYLASPPAIGGTAPSAGTFTTLKGNSLAKVFATNTSAQSIPAGANTPVTGWTTGVDVNSNFTASTGTFTAPATGYYVVSAQLLWGVMAGAGASNVLKAVIFANGAASNLVGIAGASSTTQQFNSVQVSGIVSLTAGQTIVLNAVQATGSSVALSSTAGSVWISIYQLP